MVLNTITPELMHLPMGNLICLVKSDLAPFIETCNTQQSAQHGIMMKEYAVVPEALFSDITSIKPFFHQSYAYAKALKPKATSRTKKSQC